MARLEDVQRLGARIDEELSDASKDTSNARHVRLKLFGEYAALWNAAEAAGDAETLGALLTVRQKLRTPSEKPGFASKLSMLFRLLLTAFVALWGCVCILCLTPVRLTHPLLRSLGLRNGQLPLDVLCYFWGQAVLAAAGVKVRVEGDAEEAWKDVRCGVIVYNHGSNLDPFIINQACGGYSPKYIGKKIIFQIPVIGWLFLLAGMVPINRGNREKAVATMSKVVGGIMKTWGRCVAIAPEGTRSTDGHLTLPFKKGAFHLQDQTKAPLMPLVIFGAHELWPPGQLFTWTGQVRVTTLPVQPAQGADGSTDQARLKLQQTLAEATASRADWCAEPLSVAASLQNVLILACTGVIFWLFRMFLRYLVAALGLGSMSLLALFSLTSGVVATLVEVFK